MRITTFLKELILEESRFDALYSKFVGEEGEKNKLSFDVLKELIFADPTTVYPEGINKETATIEDMSLIKKIGDYVNWLIMRYLKPKQDDIDLNPEIPKDSKQYNVALERYHHLFMEDLYKVTEYLEYYHRVKKIKNFPYEKNIDKLSIDKLREIYADYKIPSKEKDSEEKKEARKSREGFNHIGGEIIHEGNDWTVIKISDKGQKGKDAAIWYGGYKDYQNGESNWCTSSPGLTYFEGYIKDGPLYIIFPNDDKGQVGGRTGLPKERYQFHFPSNQFMNRDNNRIDVSKMLNGSMSEIKHLFKEEFFKKFAFSDKNNKRIDIQYPKDSNSTFVTLYGFEELFKLIPKDITGFVFENKSDEDSFGFNLPENIGDYTELESISLTNIIKSIPESIGNLKKLTTLTLEKNKSLRKLPNSIINLLPNNGGELIFILLTGSDNVDLSNPVFKYFVEEGSRNFFFNKEYEQD